LQVVVRGPFRDGGCKQHSGAPEASIIANEILPIVRVLGKRDVRIVGVHCAAQSRASAGGCRAHAEEDGGSAVLDVECRDAFERDTMRTAIQIRRVTHTPLRALCCKRWGIVCVAQATVSGVTARQLQLLAAHSEGTRNIIIREARDVDVLAECGNDWIYLCVLSRIGFSRRGERDSG